MCSASKNWLILLVIVFLAIAAPVCLAAERTDFIISSPGAGEKWYPNSAHEIVWTASPEFKSKLNPKNPRKVHVFARGLDTPNFAVKENVLLNPDGSGRLTWSIPSNIPAGRFRIQVTNADGIYASGHSAIFNIAPVPKTSLKFTSPAGGETWYKGATYTISWNYSHKYQNNPITLQLNGPRGLTIVTSYPNSGFEGTNSYQFLVPRDLPDGEYYITGHYALIRERSAAFTVADSSRLQRHRKIDPRR